MTNMLATPLSGPFQCRHFLQSLLTSSPLDQQPLSEVQRIRLLGAHARLSQAEGDFEKATGLFLEARQIAGRVYKWGLATDLVLLAIESLINGGDKTAANELLEKIKNEAQDHDRMDFWQVLKQRVLQGDDLGS